jgi:hypothetical protein
VRECVVGVGAVRRDRTAHVRTLRLRVPCVGDVRRLVDELLHVLVHLDRVSGLGSGLSDTDDELLTR